MHVTVKFKFALNACMAAPQEEWSAQYCSSHIYYYYCMLYIHAYYEVLVTYIYVRINIYVAIVVVSLCR